MDTIGGVDVNKNAFKILQLFKQINICKNCIMVNIISSLSTCADQVG